MDTQKFLDGFEAFIKEAGLDSQAAFAVRYCLPLVNMDTVKDYVEKQAGPLNFEAAREAMSEAGPESMRESMNEAQAEAQREAAEAGTETGSGAVPPPAPTPPPAPAPDPSMWERAGRATGQVKNKIGDVGGAIKDKLPSPYQAGKAVRSTGIMAKKLAVPAALAAPFAMRGDKSAMKPDTDVTKQNTIASNGQALSGPGSPQTGAPNWLSQAGDWAAQHPWMASGAIGLPLGAAALTSYLGDAKSDEE